MASGETRYLPRFRYPELLEKGRDNVIACPVYSEGDVVAPSTGTVTVYDRSGASVSSPAVSVVSSVATATVPSSALSSLDYEDHWRVVWALDIAGATVTFENEAALVRRALHPVITDADLQAAHTDLANYLPDTNTGFQEQIEEAWAQIQLRLYNLGQRPQLLASPTSFRLAHLELAYALIYDGFDQHGASERFADRAQRHRERFEVEWKALSFTYDADQDGVVDDGDRRTTARGPMFLASPGRGY